ncbi:MAG TPA: hypothetical protein GXX26_11165 [Clostridiaceae bacterium]|nr:hypothetical protein [Clostridiaceae bacterium]
MENSVPQRPYTRKGPDIICRMVDIASVILWGFIIVNFAIILWAKPVGETFFDRLFNISVRDYWDAAMLQISLFLSLAQLLVSIFSLYLNSKRLKRKDDRIRISIIVSIFVASFICMFLTVFLYFT